MKKTIVFSCLAVFLFAQDDYVPLSELSNAKKIEYNFVDKKKKIETPKVQEYKTIKIEENKYEAVSPIEEVEIKEDIIENNTNFEKIENIKEEKKIVNKELVKEYKSENILQDTKENKVSITEDFSITPKLTYSYLKTDIYATDRISVVDEKSVLIPEIAVSFKNHTLKAEVLEVESYFNQVILGGSDLETTVKWYKLYYLYNYNNISFGLAYNDFSLNWNAVNYNISSKDKEEFPSLELHMKNSDKNLQVEYGLSYGKNNNITYSYEYYLNLGYKILKDNDLILSAGYKNRVIEYNFPNKEVDYEYQFKGPTISISGTF
jgi:hypothetical protein